MCFYHGTCSPSVILVPLLASLVEEQSGIIGQVAADLFVLLGERAADVRSAADVRVSYVELYREELRDLLELHTAHRELHIREDDRGNTGNTPHCLC